VTLHHFIGLELALIRRISNQMRGAGLEQTFWRLETRLLSSLFDSYLESLNEAAERRRLLAGTPITKNDIKNLNGSKGVLEFYNASIRCFARSLGKLSPLGGELQISGKLREWPSLRSRIVHPKSVESYQLRPEDFEVLREVMNWFDRLVQWATRLEVENIDRIQAEMNDSMDALRQHIIDQMQPKSE
jgi:hypothetical protein